MLHPSRLVLVALVAILVCTPSADSCPFCTSQGKTLLSEVSEANLVIYGTLTNSKADESEFGKGTTDIDIETIVKSHAVLGKQKKLTLPRYIPTEDAKGFKYLVFIEVFKDKLDPYRGLAVKSDSKIAEYLKGALDVQDKEVSTKLKFFFKYLDAEEQDISGDAYKEFGNADYLDFRKMTESIDPEVVVKWIKDPNTPVTRYGLYGSMLGHAGKKEKHAKILRDLLDDPEKRFLTGLDGLLSGYILLDKENGWNYLTSILKDKKKDFLVRYAALRAIRFLWEYRPDVLDKTTTIQAIMELVQQPDIADLAIEDLRKWKQWDKTGDVLKVFQLESHNVPIVKRGIIRFALAAQDMKPDAKKFVEQMRKSDAELVKDVEELLALEEPAKKEENPNPQTKK